MNRHTLIEFSLFGFGLGMSGVSATTMLNARCWGDIGLFLIGLICIVGGLLYDVVRRHT
jgi:1,4-dihydroxy-2-naphthoate octaprenyltransferase